MTRGPDLRLLVPAGSAWGSAALLLGARAATAYVAALVLLGLAAAITVASWQVNVGRAFVVVASLGTASAAAAVTGLHIAALRAGPLPRLAARHTPVDLDLRVTGDPVAHTGRVTGSALHRGSTTVPAAATRVHAGRINVRIDQPVFVIALGSGWASLLPGQRLQVSGVLEPPLPGQQVTAAVVARGPPRQVHPAPVTQRLAGALRGGLRSAVGGQPADERGLLPGLVLGDVSRMPAALTDDFRTAGLTHLVAVSGENCAIVLAAVVLLVRGAGLRWWLRPLVSLTALGGFVLLVRPSPSVLRAAVMGVVALLALTRGRRAGGVPVLSAATLALVLWQPALARSAGFALSVLATGGLLLLAPRLRRGLRARLPARVADAIAIPAAAQLACTPLLAAIAGQVSLVAIPANLLAAPAVAPATLLGLAATLVAPLSLTLAHVVAWLAFLPTAWLVGDAHLAARLPLAALGWPAGATGAVLALGAVALLAVAVRVRPARRIGTAALAATVGTTFFFRVAGPAWPPADWALAVCDVGQGDGLVLHAAPHVAVVVDAGPDPVLMGTCLRRLDVQRVPIIVLTHFHADHVEGLPGVLSGRSVGAIEVGPLDEPPEEVARVRRWAEADGVPLVPVHAGESQSVGDLRWQVIAPAHAFHGTDSDPNNSSIVLRVQLPGFTALLTGDVEPDAQQELLDAGVDLRADLLKIPHHGSADQLPAFLAAVRPEVAIASAGIGNPYGHPAASTLRALRAERAAVFRTDLDGSLIVSCRHGHLVVSPSRPLPAHPPPGPVAAAPAARVFGRNRAILTR